MTPKRLTRAYCFGALLLIGYSPAYSATFNVSSFDDSAPTSGCASTCVSLRDAVVQANRTSAVDTINLNAGTYTLSQNNAVIEENLSYTGDLDVIYDLTIRGFDNDPNSTIIDAGGNTGILDRILHVVDPNSGSVTLTLENLTITGGFIDGKSGGAILVDSGATLILKNVVVRNNLVGNAGALTGVAGGGVYNAGTLTVTDSLFADNTIDTHLDESQANFGGGGVFNSGTATIKNSHFRRNHSFNLFGNIADFSSGGAILNTGTLFLEDSVLGGENDTITESYESGVKGVANQSEGGAGISNIGGFLTINRTLIARNTTATSTTSDLDGREGGGVFSQNAGENRGRLLISNSTISFNDSTKQGGGIFNSGVPFTLVHSTINNNTAVFLGAGVVSIGNEASEISNSTIAYNTADSSSVFSNTAKGGGLFTTSRININSVTFAGNTANNGTQIYVQDNSSLDRRTPQPQVTLENTIVDHAPTTQLASQNCEGTTQYIISRGYNLDTGESCGFATSSDIRHGLPYLETSLAENSAYDSVAQQMAIPDTKTIALDPNTINSSEAHDAGPTAGTGCPSRDQRYFTRTGSCDIGAFEHEGIPGTQDISDLKVTIRENQDPAITTKTLVYTVSVINLGPQAASNITMTFTRPDLSHTLDAMSRDGVLDNNTCTINTNNTLTCFISAIANFETKTFGFTVTPSAAGTATVSAEVSAPGGVDYFPANNTFEETTEIQDVNNCDRDVPGCSPFASSAGGGGGWLSMPTLAMLLAWLGLVGYGVRKKRRSL